MYVPPFSPNKIVESTTVGLITATKLVHFDLNRERANSPSSSLVNTRVFSLNSCRTLIALSIKIQLWSEEQKFLKKQPPWYLQQDELRHLKWVISSFSCLCVFGFSGASFDFDFGIDDVISTSAGPPSTTTKRLHFPSLNREERIKIITEWKLFIITSQQ